MGICLEAYRARIGHFQFCGHTRSKFVLYNHVLLMTIMLNFGLPMWLITLIMLSGDIESNPGPVKHLSGILLNTRSVKSVNRNRNKLIDFQSIVHTKKASIICLSETWLNEEVLDSEILPSSLFNIFRKDRNGKGGGVLIAVLSEIVSKNRPDLVPPDTGLTDIIVVELNVLGQSKTALVGVYIPPGSHNTGITALRQTLQTLWDNNYHNINLLGDFNLPNIDPITDTPTSNAFCAHAFYDLFCDFNLVHCVHEPTHRLGNRLDLLLSNTPEKFSNISTEDDIFSSDHFLVNFTMIISPSILFSKCNRSVFNYKRADWMNLKAGLRELDLISLMRGHNASEACKIWSEEILNLANKFIPKLKINNPDSPPWIDGEVLSLSKKKERARKRALSSNNPNHWATYRRLRNSLKTLINNKHNQYIIDSSSNISSNPKRFWSIVRSKTKTKSFPTEICNGNLKASSSQEKADLFNDFFYSNFSYTNDEELPEIESFINPNLTGLTLDVVDIRLLLTTINANKATGPDGLSGRFLKECSAEIAPSLTWLFNLSLSTGHVPEIWRSANVIPVFKKGDKSLCKNYRPVSLLCIVSKILERAVLNRTINFFSQLITKAQHGFLQGRSTSTQLLTVFHEINKCLDSGTQTDCIYLDFSKAFDSVPHNLLCHKLKAFGFSDRLHAWFCSYLSNRMQRVMLEGTSSSWLPVSSGVPQGSILGPILFLLYTNDIGMNLSVGTQLALYADDAKIFRPIQSLQDCLSLQSDLLTLQMWSNKWGLKFNTTKCQILTIGRVVRHTFNYSLNNSNLDHITEFNDLGVTITNFLSWNAHIHKIVAKANRLLGLIKRTLGFQAPAGAKLILYNSLVRSTLLYASTIWYPNKSGLKLLEGVQRKATKYILNDYVNDYKTRLKNLGLLPICYFREFHDLCFFYKCLHGYCDLDLTNLVPFRDPPAVHTRSAQDPLKLKNITTRTETAKHFFSQRIINIWNNLPLDIRSTLCSNKKIIPFKTKVFLYYCNKLTTEFNTDNTCTWVSHCTCSSCRPI